MDVSLSSDENNVFLNTMMTTAETLYEKQKSVHP